MHFIQILILAVVQGFCELLPVSSSAHVIVAERLMGLDPAAPEMTFLLVMLHTGTMGAVLVFFWSRWKKSLLHPRLLKMLVLATGVTGVLGLGLKAFIEKIILGNADHSKVAEVEMLFRNLPLMAASLFAVGLVIVFAGMKNATSADDRELGPTAASWIGAIQGLCLPFRGFSRSGATVSMGLFCGISRVLAEEFSFALAVILTPPVVFREGYRLIHAHAGQAAALDQSQLAQLLVPGLVGMGFSCLSGFLALRWLSSWLENGKWKYFGYYCLLASVGVLCVHFFAG